MKAALVLLLFLLDFLAVAALVWRTHRRWERGQDERAGRVGGFGRTGQEQRGRTGTPSLTPLDVLLALLAGGALLGILLAR